MRDLLVAPRLLVPPKTIYATFDEKYGVLTVHPDERDQAREVARDPALIKAITYELQPTS